LGKRRIGKAIERRTDAPSIPHGTKEKGGGKKEKKIPGDARKDDDRGHASALSSLLTHRRGKRRKRGGDASRDESGEGEENDGTPSGSLLPFHNVSVILKMREKNGRQRRHPIFVEEKKKKKD